MAWDPVRAVGATEPLYFGPLAGYDAEELNRRGLDQDKKTAKGFNWFSKKKPENNAENKNTKPLGPPSKAWDDSPPTPQVGQWWRKGDPEEIPTWDEFSQKTTFHGVRYIFDKTPFRTRRYFFKL